MKKQTKRAIPYETISKLWKAGTSYEQIAKQIHRYHPSSSDPTKHVRAIVSRMLRKGWKDSHGKTQVLPIRKQMRNKVGANKLTSTKGV